MQNNLNEKKWFQTVRGDNLSNAIRYIIWTILSIGMVVIAIMFFWVFLIILGIVIIARLIYMRLFNKNPKNAVTFYSYTMYNGKPVNNQNIDHNINSNEDQDFTTVIDADDQEKEYKIPKLK